MHDWSKIISAGVGPIIVISACGLLCLAFYNRLAAVVSRLRSLHRERLVETERLAKARLQAGTGSLDVVRAQELLGMLKVQTDRVRRRAYLIRATLLCLLITIGCLALCSLALGLSTLFSGLIIPAATLFILGMLTMVLGILMAMAELRQSLDPVDLEARFVMELSRDLASEDSEQVA